jgi:hypothetical protein
MAKCKTYSQDRDDEKQKGSRDYLKIKDASARHNSIDSFFYVDTVVSRNVTKIVISKRRRREP